MSQQPWGLTPACFLYLVPCTCSEGQERWSGRSFGQCVRGTVRCVQQSLQGVCPSLWVH